MAVAASACTFDGGIETTRFRCEVDADCPEGTTCGADLLCGEGDDDADGGAAEEDGGGVCPCSLWGDDVLPPMTDGDDPVASELGVRVRFDDDGVVTAIRFYKALLNTGTHVGNIWEVGGANLASVTFEDETASGWQEAALPEPLAVEAGETLVVSYFAPAGHYAYQPDYFGSDVVRGPLRALADSGATPNGVFLYDLGGGFPSETNASANYWVDLVFDDTP